MPRAQQALPDPSEPSDEVEYCGIRLAKAALCELEGSRSVVEIPRVDIRSITLCHGIAAERPVRTILLSAALIFWGAFFARDLVLWQLRGGTAYDFEAYGVALIPLGAWLIHYALRRRYLLEVTTDRSTRKLVFDAPADEHGTRQFAEAVGRAMQRPVLIVQVTQRG